ncbi:MAG: beta-galactosidase [Parcubacteria group bacterium]|jgi:hypothetical protein
MTIIKNFFKVLLVAVSLIISLIIGIFIYFNLPVNVANGDAKLGVTYSARYAKDIGVDWKENYLAILDDLGIKKIRIPVYWDLIEPKEGEYNFDDLDWQLNEARQRDAEIILTVGQKVPRWPECFIPDWTKNDPEKKNPALLRMVNTVVERYKNNPEVKYWQVENEPFLDFGICPIPDTDLLGSEVALVRNLDPSRKVIVTDSGELSLWYKAASYADVFGTTMYRTIWKEGFGYFDYPIGPRFFQAKLGLVNLINNKNEAIVVELQAEPWINGWTTSGELSEQFKSMNAQKLQENVEFARKVGFPEIYLWGAEWWYWLKTTQDHPELWDTARTLFDQNNVLK